jgi:hypothetical protein
MSDDDNAGYYPRKGQESYEQQKKIARLEHDVRCYQEESKQQADTIKALRLELRLYKPSAGKHLMQECPIPYNVCTDCYFPH